MKKEIFLSVVFVIVMSMNIGCEKLDVTKDIDMEVEFVAISETAAFYSEDIFDATESSSVIDDYKDKITKIEVINVTAWLTAFNGPVGQKLLFDTLSVADTTGNGEIILGTIADQPLEPLLITPIELTLNQAGIDYFATLIKDSPHKALIKNFGTTDSQPVDFTAKFKFTVKMTANPL